MIQSSLFLINGPNINLLGKREPDLYGNMTLEDLEGILQAKCKSFNLRLDSFQSNHEGAIIDVLQNGLGSPYDCYIINAASLTHTSIGIRDTLLALRAPVIEVHITNIYARDDFRARSVLSDIAIGVISGFGIHSYELAIDAAYHYLNNLKEVQCGYTKSQKTYRTP